jgi:signal peptidase I
MKRAIGLLFLFVVCIAGFLTAKGTAYFIPISGDNMEPALKSGTLLTIEPVDAASIKVGDIIIYNVPKTMREYYNYPPMVSRRVIAIETAPSLGFRTKGDNAGEDPFTVKPIDILGTAGKQIPYLGLPLILFQSLQGLILVILALAVLAFFLYINEILGGRASLRRPIFIPVNKEEKLHNRAPTRKGEATEKKTETAKPAREKVAAAISEKPQPQPKKAAIEKAKPLPAAAKKPASPGGTPKREGLTEEAQAAEKEIFDALDRLHEKLKKPKDQV